MSKQQGPLDLGELAGGVAIVTGAGNNGIGWGLAQRAADLGMKVAIVDLHERLVDRAAASLRELYPSTECLGIAADVTRPDMLDAALATIDTAWDTPEIAAVFANAGVIFNRSVLRSTVDEWTTTLNVNVLGVVNTIKAFVPRLREQERQSIICNTASVGGLVRGDGGGAAYQASKHAVVALSESLSFELAARSPQVRVHVLCPCIVQTALGETSQTNRGVRDGELRADELVARDFGGAGLAMKPERHAEQVFDQIAAGNFYVITDNVRPYVDHDFPFDALGIVRERVDNLLRQQIDNADAFTDDVARPSAILKGPMFREMRRRARDENQS